MSCSVLGLGLEHAARSSGPEVRDLKDEIRRIKEVEGKSLCDHKGEDNEEKGSNTRNNENTITALCSHHGAPPDMIQDHDMNELVNSRLKTEWPVEQHVADAVSESDIVCAKQWDLAWSPSLFSAILALLVGITVWEAKDPCMPLVSALSVVVFMSLSSVVKFFCTIQHKPTTDAVALLSFNWFMFGILLYPMLPVFARISSLLASILLG
ncbi:hypothetical protein F511_30026 [Dorcoceras hygrometricum]|uniref:Uncharacterized protein n=1 Tax=Dorcoceras hygrometricum TaxID=472368 RepID=A0A2Z7CSS5_9LAMI|nr:hypothetical protein F511_30026 [Dorcoceras hygrometricum]